MDRIDVSEEWAATARMELQSAIHVQNAGDQHQMSLDWLADGSGGQIGYRGCRVLFSLGESQDAVGKSAIEAVVSCFPWGNHRDRFPH